MVRTYIRKAQRKAGVNYSEEDLKKGIQDVTSTLKYRIPATRGKGGDGVQSFLSAAEEEKIVNRLKVRDRNGFGLSRYEVLDLVQLCIRQHSMGSTNKQSQLQYSRQLIWRGTKQILQTPNAVPPEVTTVRQEIDSHSADIVPSEIAANPTDTAPLEVFAIFTATVPQEVVSCLTDAVQSEVAVPPGGVPLQVKYASTTKLQTHQENKINRKKLHNTDYKTSEKSDQLSVRDSDYNHSDEEIDEHDVNKWVDIAL
ncbi:hypothetical protein ILUMI_27347 [Ignelater luminosus]|uniref:Uncharacterized protein n=1 Tax=Ignelater luminosus TaxID=2038154 RepID=A0A8K0C6B7_IGNLU|nr:hypothetical protein ILUMI_27347 [Ignelater luminosus]